MSINYPVIAAHNGELYRRQHAAPATGGPDYDTRDEEGRDDDDYTIEDWDGMGGGDQSLVLTIEVFTLPQIECAVQAAVATRDLRDALAKNRRANAEGFRRSAKEHIDRLKRLVLDERRAEHLFNTIGKIVLG